MIKFFRLIRQRTIKENRFSKYLLYAIGEIFLVVVGILIALQINNWNEERKEVVKERELLSNLKEEFEDNLKDLDSIAVEVDLVIASLEKVFDLFEPAVTDQPLDSLNIWLSRSLNSPNWKPSDYILNSLNSSGSIRDLNNERLKLLLYKWSRQHKEMLEVHDRTEQTGEEIIAYIKFNGSLRNVDVANKDFNYRSSSIFNKNQLLLSDYIFENQIDDKLYMYRLTKQWLERARITISDLIEETNI